MAHREDKDVAFEDSEPLEVGPAGLEEDVDDEREHPYAWALRGDRLPHIWCPGCGIGTTVSCFIQALEKTNTSLDGLCVVSGIGCTGRVAAYMNCDAFHTTHGRAIPFATGIHLGNPDLKVVVISGDGDLVAIGGNHLIHAARRNLDITVICVNNFNYGMTGGQHGPTTQIDARTRTTLQGNNEYPFNLPRLLAAAGATYVARWTVLDLGRLRRSMVEALEHKGFSFVEVISPCPVYYGRLNRLDEGIKELKYYWEGTSVDPMAPIHEIDLAKKRGRITVGTFVQETRPTWLDLVGGETGGASASVLPQQGANPGEPAPAPPTVAGKVGT
jgi:2-oxoglutarate/2-oxoacid ferredoxin oxidoreductase subunit beta